MRIDGHDIVTVDSGGEALESVAAIARGVVVPPDSGRRVSPARSGAVGAHW